MCYSAQHAHYPRRPRSGRNGLRRHPHRHRTFLTFSSLGLLCILRGPVLRCLLTLFIDYTGHHHHRPGLDSRPWPLPRRYKRPLWCRRSYRRRRRRRDSRCSRLACGLLATSTSYSTGSFVDCVEGGRTAYSGGHDSVGKGQADRLGGLWNVDDICQYFSIDTVL